MFEKSLGKKYDAWYILFGIWQLTSCTPKFRHIYVITYSNFIVIVEPWEHFFLLGLVNFMGGVRLEIMYISHHNVNTHSSPCFPAAWAATTVHRNHFFCLLQQSKSSESKVKFRQVSNCCERVLEAAKRSYANKTTWLLWLLANCS